MTDYKIDRKEYDRVKYHEYRKRNMLFLTNGKEPECATCGSKESLEFDHIDPEDKRFHLNQRKSLKKEDYLEELGKCQILCKTCHEKKTSSENIRFSHGSMRAFQKYKCKCQVCEDAKLEYYKRRNAARRKPGGYGPRS